MEGLEELWETPLYKTTSRSTAPADVMLLCNCFENLDATNCAGTSSCHSGQQCNSHKLWDDLNSVVDEFLSEISITDLVEKPKDPHIPLKEIKS